MPAWVWVLIAVVLAACAAAVVWTVLSKRRTASLRERFGPEYERVARSHERQRDAEAELSGRLERRKQLEIRPLAPAARDRYVASWRQVQAEFVDAPQQAVGRAHGLVCSVMAERGYPVDDFEQQVADVSVDHATVVDNYRAAHAIAQRAERGEATTEDLRQAMQHYRLLFDDLLETGADEPLTRESTSDVTATEGTTR